MKIKALSRSATSAQAPGSSVTRLSRNLDPDLHPFERAREYTRALNATKLERMFAAPFVTAFEPGHVDGIYSFAKDPESYDQSPLAHLDTGLIETTGSSISPLEAVMESVRCGIFPAERRYSKRRHTRT